MEIKKSPAADLEPHRTTRLLVGFVVALAVLFVALEWTEQDDIDSVDALLSDLVFEEELEVPLVEHPIVPLPVPAKPLPVVEDKLTVVENDVAEDSPVEFSAEPLGSGGEERIEEDVYDLKKYPASEEPFVVVDILPEFPWDGQKGLMRYLTQHIHYPQPAWEHHIQGTDVQVLQGIHPLLDSEAVRVLGGMPRWKPGMRGGKAVRVRYTLPVVFQL